MTEEQLGKAMKAHALGEGKIGRIPASVKQAGNKGQSSTGYSDETRRRILERFRETGSRNQVARDLGVSLGGVSQVVKRAGL